MMRRAIYLIEVLEASSADIVADFIGLKIYGRTALERNLAILRALYDSVDIVFLLKDSDSVASLEEFKYKKFNVPSTKIVAIQSSVDALDIEHYEDKYQAVSVIYQLGMGLLAHSRSSFAVGIPISAHILGKSKSRDIPLAEIVRVMRARANNESGLRRLLAEIRIVKSQSEEDSVAILYPPNVSIEYADEIPGKFRSKLLEILHNRASARSIDGPFSRLIFRRFSARISKPLSNFGVHPNFLTSAAALLGLIAVFLFATGQSKALVVGSLLWVISAILDEADGEAARLQDRQSSFGGWLDGTLDRILDSLLIFALAWPLIANDTSSYYLLLAIVASTFMQASSYLGLLYDGWMRQTVGLSVYFRIGRDSRTFIIFACAILNLRAEAIWIILIISTIEIIRRLSICLAFERARVNQL